MQLNTTTAKQGVHVIHPEGLYRWSEFSDRMPFGREAWRRRILTGSAPKGLVLGPTCTVWRGEDILEWLNNPATYSKGA